jgi:hypothetical protein
MTKRGILFVAEAITLAALAACGGGGGTPEAGGPTAASQSSGEEGSRQIQAVTDAAPNLVVRARADLAGNVGAQMQLRVNGTVVASTEVRATSYQDYPFTLAAIAAGAKVDVAFTNDDATTGDRNLFVESITVNGTKIAANAAGVTFDRGAGAKAFDGQDVLPGLGTLWWAGALRFTAPGQPATATGLLSPACAAFYAASPNFALDASRTVLNDGTPPKPARGAAFAEPSFKTCITRTTDHTADGVATFAQNEYSRREAFNVNNTLQLVIGIDSYWHVYDANTHAHLTKLPSFGSDAEPQWDPANPDLLFVIPNYGMEMKLKHVNARTGVVTDAPNGNYGPQVKAIWSNASLAYTRDEGSPSKDGRFWCFMVMNVPTSGDWKPLGVFTWDRDANKILSYVQLNGENPDHVSMSPSGKYCVVSSDGPLGTVAYLATDFTKKVQLHHKSEHSDLGIDAAGRDVYVSVSYETSSQATRSAAAKTANLTEGDVFFRYLDTGEITPLVNIYGGQDSGAMHFSAKNYNRPGWMLMETYADSGDGSGSAPTKWMQRRLFAVQLKANPAIYNLAFTRFPYVSGNAPRASVNRDFTRVVFNSSWKGNYLDADVYSVEIPAGALKDTGTASTASTAPSAPMADTTTPPPATTPPVTTAPVTQPPVTTTPTTPTTTTPTTPTTPTTTTPATPLTATLVSASRKGYTMKFEVKTSVAAHCRNTWSSGNPYAILSENLTIVVDPLHPENTGKLHMRNNFIVGTNGPQTVYVVCKADASVEEKQVTVQVK